ncbi:MAG: 4Fe-4S dicluster domain-containing protein [Candidatus Omnitrophota bacterium]
MKKLHVDIARCTGCRSCEIACALEHSKSKDIIQAIFESPLPRTRINIVGAPKKFYPLVCRRCEEPRCVDACIAGALVKEKDEIIFREERCVGCHSCILACPYSSISQRKDYSKVALCDLCKERETGKRACEEACPTRCVFYGEDKEFMEIINEPR